MKTSGLSPYRGSSGLYQPPSSLDPGHHELRLHILERSEHGPCGVEDNIRLRQSLCQRAAHIGWIKVTQVRVVQRVELQRG